jgi:hypothetical protein
MAGTDKILLKYMHLPVNILEDFSKAKTSEIPFEEPTGYPAYCNNKNFGKAVGGFSKKYGVSNITGIDFATFYLSGMEDRSSAKNFNKAGKVCFVYNIGAEPVENKTLASSLLKFLVTSLEGLGKKVILVSDEMSGTIQRAYGVQTISRV